MKNKVLALGAAIFLAAAAAFAFSQTSTADCCANPDGTPAAGCDVQAGTCCGLPCPVPCCER